jgi:hypothetical protein
LIFRHMMGPPGLDLSSLGRPDETADLMVNGS